jgi:hypothetical protein
MSVDGIVKLLLDITHTSPADLSTPSQRLQRELVNGFSSGVGANQADKLWHDTRTLTASQTEDLDLSGVLLDVFGAAFTLAKLRMLAVRAATGNTNNVNVSRPAANGVPLFLAASDGVPVVPGGTFLFIAPNAAGIAVTAGTGDLVTVTNSAGGTSVTYDVYALGTSS